MKYYLVFDIGGTKTAVGLYDKEGNEVYYGKILTEHAEGPEKLLDRLYTMTEHLFKPEDIIAAGIACPGPLDIENGIVNNTTTLGWKNIPLVKMFSDKFGIGFAFLNDCNAGAYGEYIRRNCRNMVYVSVSTGIGGGIIMDGKLYNGNGNAAEFGHMYVAGNKRKCGCGRDDCLELYASGTAVEKEYFQLTGKTLCGTDIANLANIGDSTAITIYHNCAKYISKAIVDIQKILDPELIVIGGGVATAKPFRNDSSFEKIKKYGVQIAFSELAGKQVLVGMMAYVRDFGINQKDKQ